MVEEIIGIYEGTGLIKLEKREPGPTSYTSPTSYTVGKLRHVKFLEYVDIDGGYKAEGEPAATGNVVHIRVYYQSGVSGAPLTEVATGTDLSARTIKMIVVGT